MKTAEKDGKWYSNGMSREEAGKLDLHYAKITDAKYGILDYRGFGLHFVLTYANGCQTGWGLWNASDIRELVERTRITKAKELNGKVIEAYNKGYNLRCISVNENLI